MIKALSIVPMGMATVPGAAVAQAAQRIANSGSWTIPDEAAPHKRTWMAFGASATIWGKRLLPDVQRNLATLARTIARYEPVTMLVRQGDHALGRELTASAVELVVCPLDDLWVRDTGPVFMVNRQGGKAALDLNFNGWGNKQAHADDANVAAFVARQAGVAVLNTKLVLEGGGIETDGQGTAIISESCVVHANRNPRLSKAQIEVELKAMLGLEHIIWLPGIKGRDITDGHTDFYARFARPGVVCAGYDADPQSFDHAVTKRHLALLQSATDARGRKLQVIVLQAPGTVRAKHENKEFAAGYVGFYVCNGAVIAQEFGDQRADLAARDALRRAFPGREVVQINVDAIAAGGGSIHCATQQEPAI